MFQFFVKQDQKEGTMVRIYGDDFHHMSQVIRLKEKEIFRVSFIDGEKENYLCELSYYENNCAIGLLQKKEENFGEVEGSIILFQGLPKSDKMEWIIQKAVELGVTEIVPVAMEHSVVKLDEKKASSKLQRWQTICLNAAKQSKRSKIPQIQNIMSFQHALEYANQMDLVCLPYENQQGVTGTLEFLNQIRSKQTIGIMIGPEGGFSEKEINLLPEKIIKVSLGKRILRTETAAIISVGMVMMQLELVNEQEEQR